MEKAPLAAAYFRATLIEATYWLSMGANIGYFPDRASTSAISLITSDLVLNALEFLSAWGYTLNPFLRSKFESWLARPTSSGLDVTFESESAARCLFKSLLGQAGRFSRDRLAQAFVVLIDYYTRDDLRENLVDRPVFLEDICRTIETRQAFDPESGEVRIPAAYAGFSIWLDYLSGFRSTYEGALGSDWIGSQDARSLLRFASQAQAWRFYGLSSESLAFADARETVISAVARAYRLAAVEATELHNLTHGLIGFWERSSAIAGGASG